MGEIAGWTIGVLLPTPRHYWSSTIITSLIRAAISGDAINMINA